MCNEQTTELCDNLQNIAIAATVDPSFGEWLRDVELALHNKSAIAHRSNHVLYNCYKNGLTPSFVATRLDQTFDAMKPSLFRAEVEERKAIYDRNRRIEYLQEKLAYRQYKTLCECDRMKKELRELKASI